MHSQLSQPICTVLIPAYNEANVIGATLKSLMAESRRNEFEVIVVCNGCSDGTADAARKAATGAKVFELEDASKTRALNAGMAAAVSEKIVFLDADIHVSAMAVRNLIHRLDWSGAVLAYGNARFDVENSSWAVRAFYKAWLQNPYFDQQKMGGFFAVSTPGLKLLGTLPDTTNDDEYIRRALLHNATYADAAPYGIKAPRNLWSLIKVRSRVYRGNKELEGSELRFGQQQLQQNGKVFAARLAGSPKFWFGAAIFALATVTAHLRNLMLPNSTSWDQDSSNREHLVG